MENLKTRAKDLTQEVAALKEENALLEAQVQFQQNIFNQIKEALGMVGQLETEVHNNNLVRSLLRENVELKNRLMMERLTNREKEVLRYIANGYKSKEIATQMEISKLTVDTYRKHIQKKLKVANIVELVRMASDGGFV